MKKITKTIIVSLIVLALLIVWFKYYSKNFTTKHNNTDIVISIKTTQSNQTLTINKYFSNKYTVNWWDWTKRQEIIEDTTHTYKKAWKYNVILSLTPWYKRRTFDKETRKALIPINYTTIAEAKIISMPSLAEWFGDNKEEPWDNFFAYFNFNWIINSLPEGSFDTSQIKKAWNNFFASFNEYEKERYDRWIEPPPTSFKKWWLITELPKWSFNTKNITTVWNNFFAYFNSNWNLTSLPEWSFNTKNISWVVGYYFFSSFNNNWLITKLPKWSFNTTNITTVWNNFFTYFNANWNLTSLPEWSFDISNITTIWDYFFYSFNYSWKITELPKWSFDISNIRKKWKGFFEYFNWWNWSQWAMKNAPDFENIRKEQIGERTYDKNDKKNIIINIQVTKSNQKIKINKYFSNEYNVDWWEGLVEWLLEDTTHTYEKTWTYNIILSLAEWDKRRKFQDNGVVWKPLIPKKWTNTTNIKIISMPSLAEWFGESKEKPGDYFFEEFNYDWAITELPEGSFDTSNIETVWNNFFAEFNRYWEITELPEGSFNISNIKIVGNSFFNWFNGRWKITNLPKWSFDTSNITTVGDCFFCNFNHAWAITELPKWSFDISNIRKKGENFFLYFNWAPCCPWNLTEIPDFIK